MGTLEGVNYDKTIWKAMSREQRDKVLSKTLGGTHNPILILIMLLQWVNILYLSSTKTLTKIYVTRYDFSKCIFISIRP